MLRSQPHFMGCSDDVRLQQLTFDAHDVADCCLTLEFVEYSDVGPGIYCVGYREVGIALPNSGGAALHDGWMGQSFRAYGSTFTAIVAC